MNYDMLQMVWEWEWKGEKKSARPVKLMTFHFLST
jgi:hypothetical protein